MSNYQNEFDQIFEGAKENLIEDFDDKVIDLLDKIERFNPNEIQEYYLTETYVNLANIVNRAKQIKPLFIKRQGPLCLGNKYREAVLCYLNGRFDACCIMSRTIIESILRDLNGRKTEKCSLSELIKISAKSRILSEKTLKLATDIRKRGNISAHKRKLAGEQDAIESIKDTQSFIKSIF